MGWLKLAKSGQKWWEAKVRVSSLSVFPLLSTSICFGHLFIAMHDNQLEL